MVSVPRLELDDAQRRSLEKAARDVRRAVQTLAEAKQRRNGLVVSTLADVGDRHGAVAAVARAAGITIEATRQLRRNPADPWERS